MKRLTIPLLFLLICGLRLEAQAQSCQLNNPTNVQFGTYSSAAIKTSTSFSVNCTSGFAYSIGISAGASGSTANRTLVCSQGCTPSTLGYELFSNASYSINWGGSTSDVVSGIGSGSNQPFTIYAEIPAFEAYFANSSSGTNYIDNVTITLICNQCSTKNYTQNLNLNLQYTNVGCGISASDLSFGNYTGTVLNATTTIQVGCSKGTYSVGLSKGMGSGTSATDRRMTLTGGGANAPQLKYGLFSDSGHKTNWGNTTSDGAVSGTGNATTQTLTVFGQVPAGQTVTQGTYTDTITATLTY